MVGALRQYLRERRTRKDLMRLGCSCAEIAAFIAGIQAQFSGNVDRSVVNAENGQALAEILAARREARDGPAREKAAAETAKANAALVVGTEMKEGVKKTPSGLLIETIVEGTGATPVASSNVKVHYTGKLADGSVFDSSVERGEPATFAVAQVVKGFAEGILSMKVLPSVRTAPCNIYAFPHRAPPHSSLRSREPWHVESKNASW
jgi:FKBP-type peptidyl-prolyl cis-trans isomerase